MSRRGMEQGFDAYSRREYLTLWHPHWLVNAVRTVVPTYVQSVSKTCSVSAGWEFSQLLVQCILQDWLDCYWGSLGPVGMLIQNLTVEKNNDSCNNRQAVGREHWGWGYWLWFGIWEVCRCTLYSGDTGHKYKREPDYKKRGRKHCYIRKSSCCRA